MIDAARLDNLRVVIMAHEKLATEMILRRANRMLQRFVVGEYVQPIETSRENANEITIKETRSTIYIGTAGSRKFGRSDTIHRLLASEVAKYDDPDEFYAGPVQAVPRTGRIVLETTAQGYNFLRRNYYDAKNGRSNFHAHFFPWFWHDEYELIGPPLTDKTPEELELQRLFPEITDSKLRWRREKLMEPGFLDNPLLFNQEYPTTDHEAFIASGNTVFNTQAIDKMLKAAKPPIFKGNVDVSGSISSDPRGFVWIWKFPAPGRSYVAFGDPAEGLAKRDLSAGVVMDYHTGEIVAVWLGHIDPDQFGRQLVGLAHYYKDALLGIEVNNHGIATVITARDLGYDNLYRRMVYDQATEQETPKLGWKTDVITKPIMINDFKAAVRDGKIIIPDERILLQLMAYEEKEPASENTEYRKMGAPSGENDDLVIAVSGAFQMRKYSAPTQEENIPTNYLEHAKQTRAAGSRISG